MTQLHNDAVAQWHSCTMPQLHNAAVTQCAVTQCAATQCLALRATPTLAHVRAIRILLAHHTRTLPPSIPLVLAEAVVVLVTTLTNNYTANHC